MPTREDILFCSAALRRRLVSQHQVHKAIRVIEGLERRGIPRPMGEVLVTRGYIRPDQEQLLLEELGLRVVKCIRCGGARLVSAQMHADGACPNCQRLAEAGISNGPGGKPGSVQQLAGEIEVALHPLEDSLVGREIPPFRFLRLLGRGGMGVVYRGENMRERREVALKVLLDDLAEDERWVARFVREGRAAAALQHPNILKVYSAGELAGMHYIEMEYIRGWSLRQILDQLTRLTPAEAVAMAVPVLRALSCAHEQKIVHRDIKPDNIMITISGVVKVTDFGVAKDLSDTSSLTKTGVVMGTPWYMSPEQCAGDPVDGRTDIYSLGVTLYHALSGSCPFQVGNLSPAICSQRRHAPPLLHRKFPEIPRALSVVIGKMMEVDPRRRYLSAEEALNAFAALLNAKKVALVTPHAIIERLEAASCQKTGT